MNKLSLWSRGFLQKATVTQLVKKFPDLWKPKDHYRVKSPKLMVRGDHPTQFIQRVPGTLSAG